MEYKLEALKITEKVEFEMELLMLLEKTIELENQLDMIVPKN